MKRIAKLLLLAALAALLAPTAQAAEYELAVAGRQVTDANKDDILGDGGSVRFSLTGTNGTLTLSNAAITNTLGGYTYDSKLSGIVAVDAFALTIVLEGSNVVKAVPNTGIYANELTITGGGSLSLVPNEDLGIVAKGDLTIDGVTISAGGSSGGGIECLGNLTITNADVTASNRDSRNGIECQRLSIGGASRLEATTAGTGTQTGKKSALWFKNGIEIGDGLVVLEPSPYWIDDNTIHAEGDSGRDGALRVVIGPPVAYPLWVGSTQVTSANATNILGDGTASFVGTATNGTLFLTNARITEAVAHPGIGMADIYSGEGFDLTIQLAGSNRVDCARSTSGDYCVFARANLAITGEGTLVAEIPNGYGCGIGAYDDLRIDGATVTVSAGNTVLKALVGAIAISNATVTATSADAYGIYGGFGKRIEIADSVVTATGDECGLYAQGVGSSLAVSGASVLTAVATSDDGTALDAAAFVLGDGLAVTEPAGGAFDADEWCVIDPATGAAAKRVVIDRRFAVTVEGGTPTNTTARAGETVTVVANAPEEGKAFVEWSPDDVNDVSFAPAAAATTTFTMPARAVTVKANFSAIQIDSIPDQEWTGSAVEPDVRAQLKNVDLELVPGETYTVSYTNNVDPGTATATVTMAPPRTGHASVTFQILPPPEPPAVSNVVARQRWPWNGLVDVDYEVGGSTNLLAGVTARITFEERIEGGTGRIWVASNFLAGAEPSVDPGPHRATWDTKADGATNVVAANVVATVELVPQPTFPSVPRIRAIVGETKAVQLFVVPDGEELNFANALLNEDFYVYAPLAGSDSVSFTLAGSGESLANGHHVNSGENMTILVSVKGLRPVRDVVVGTSKTDDLSDVIIHRVFDFYESDDDPDAAASAASAAFRLDTREGPFESDGTETLTYSSIWHGDTNATVTILQNGDEDEPVAAGLADEGDAVWQVFEDGTYVLTHKTVAGAATVSAEETATFVVRGHPLVEAALRWKYAKNANGWHCAQVALTWHPSYADEISDMRLLFADRYEGSEPLAVIKTLDEAQTNFFLVSGMIKMAGNDWKYYFLNDENGKVYSERFLESGYREKLDERPTVIDGDEAGTLTSWSYSDSTRYITNGVLNADGTSFSDDITVNGRTVTLKFASKPHGLGRRTAYLVDPATVVDPLGSMETYRDVEYRVAPVDLTAFAGLADGARAFYGVSDETMDSSLDSVPKAERKICLRVVNRDYSTVGWVDNKLAILAWNVGGSPRFQPIAETMSSLRDDDDDPQPAPQPAPRPLSVAEANLSASFGLAPAAVARGAVTCRVSSMSFGEDGSLEGTFAVAAENAGGVVAESGELAGNVKFTVLGAERLGGAFEPLDPSCGAELLSRKPPYAFRVAAPGKNAFFKIHLETEDVFE